MNWMLPKTYSIGSTHCFHPVFRGTNVGYYVGYYPNFMIRTAYCFGSFMIWRIWDGWLSEQHNSQGTKAWNGLVVPIDSSVPCAKLVKIPIFRHPRIIWSRLFHTIPMKSHSHSGFITEGLFHWFRKHRDHHEKRAPRKENWSRKARFWTSRVRRRMWGCLGMPDLGLFKGI